MKKINRMTELEKRYLNEVINGQFSSKNTYTMVVKLEKAFANKFGVRHAVAMVNGTATLHGALEAAEIRPGDEIICPPLTMSATSLSILHANGTPVFADVDENTFLITPETIEKVITKNTRAIIPVSLYGLSPDVTSIMKLAEKYNLVVIEDNAQCYLGKEHSKLVGTIGDMASYSFQSSKHMTSGEGGMVITNNDDYALKLRRYTGLGYASIGLEKARITKNDIQDPNYNRHICLGWNYRMSDLCAAVALAQIERLDELVEQRRLAAMHYNDAIQGVAWLEPQFVPDGFIHSYWTYVVKITDDRINWHDFRHKFMELGGDGIYSAWQLSYLEPAFKNKNFLGREKFIDTNIIYDSGLCPVAEKLQPRLLQFKTNYWSEEDAVKQAYALKKAIAWFESNVVSTPPPPMGIL
jgi:perosamine synthetase